MTDFCIKLCQSHLALLMLALLNSRSQTYAFVSPKTPSRDRATQNSSILSISNQESSSAMALLAPFFDLLEEAKAGLQKLNDREGAPPHSLPLGGRGCLASHLVDVLWVGYILPFESPSPLSECPLHQTTFSEGLEKHLAH